MQCRSFPSWQWQEAAFRNQITPTMHYASLPRCAEHSRRPPRRHPLVNIQRHPASILTIASDEKPVADFPSDFQKPISCMSLTSTMAFKYLGSLAARVCIDFRKWWIWGCRRTRRYPNAHDIWPQAFSWDTAFASQMTSHTRSAVHILYYIARQRAAELLSMTDDWNSASMPNFKRGHRIPFSMESADHFSINMENVFILFEI